MLFNESKDLDLGRESFVKDSLLKGALLCLIASVSWGAMFPVAHRAFSYIDPFYFTLIRYSAVTVLLVLILWMKEGKKAFKLEGKGLSLWFFGTMAFAVYNLLVFWGQDLLGHPGVILASIMEALMPMTSVILLWMYKKHKPQRFTMLTIIVAFIGVFLVITKGDVTSFFVSGGQLIPVLLIFIGVLGWVVYTIGGNHFSEWSALRYSTLSCLLGTGTAGVIVMFTTWIGYTPVPTVENLIKITPEMLFMIIFPGLIALLGWNIGVSILTPINGILFINFVPITTFIISMFQGYQMTMYDFIGTLLVIVAIVANNLYQRNEVSKLAKQRLIKVE